MGIFSRIKTWWALKDSEKLEDEHVPTDEDLKEEHQDFMKNTKKLNSMVSKKKKQNIYKANPKTSNRR